jgi:hypothetical protein
MFTEHCKNAPRFLILLSFALTGSVITMSALAFEVIGIWIFTFVSVILLSVSFLAVPQVPEKPKSRSSSFVYFCCLIIICSVPLTNWPLRTMFNISRPALERLASDINLKRPVSLPYRAGLFVIGDVKIHQEIACLWIAPHPGGNIGFVRCDKKTAETKFNLWSRVAMDTNWQFISED